MEAIVCEDNVNDKIEDSVDKKKSGTVDGKSEGQVNENFFFSDRVDAPLFVARDSTHYNMTHKKRGRCIIFAYENFHEGRNLPPRKCAKDDSTMCEKTFENLGFKVETCYDLTKSQLESKLSSIREEDHSDNDCLALIFMSHGNYDHGKKSEVINVFDADILPTELWSNFTSDKCRTLAGKPKLFFIQACRGTQADPGVMLRQISPTTMRGRRMEAEIDALEKEYAIPSPSDMLIMWATYPGYFAWKSKNCGIHGSVFIHFLTKVLLEKGTKENLSSLLLTVTRNVALDFESYSPKCDYMHMSKQIPYTESTLMRKLRFRAKS